jgi:hypothetical protein
VLDVHMKIYVKNHVKGLVLKGFKLIYVKSMVGEECDILIIHKQ